MTSHRHGRVEGAKRRLRAFRLDMTV